MTPLKLILLVLGFVLFLLAGAGIGETPPSRWRLGWFGAASVALAFILA